MLFLSTTLPRLRTSSITDLLFGMVIACRSTTYRKETYGFNHGSLNGVVLTSGLVGLSRRHYNRNWYRVMEFVEVWVDCKTWWGKLSGLRFRFICLQTQLRSLGSIHVIWGNDAHSVINLACRVMQCLVMTSIDASGAFTWSLAADQ